MTDQHTQFTRALFIDGIVGVGFPHYQVGIDAERGGLATDIGGVNGPAHKWNVRILETLPTETLQELYCSLKAYEVEHAT